MWRRQFVRHNHTWLERAAFYDRQRERLDARRLVVRRPSHMHAASHGATGLEPHTNVPPHSHPDLVRALAQPPGPGSVVEICVDKSTRYGVVVLPMTGRFRPGYSDLQVMTAGGEYFWVPPTSVRFHVPWMDPSGLALDHQVIRNALCDVAAQLKHILDPRSLLGIWGADAIHARFAASDIHTAFTIADTVPLLLLRFDLDDWAYQAPVLLAVHHLISTDPVRFARMAPHQELPRHLWVAGSPEYVATSMAVRLRVDAALLHTQAALEEQESFDPGFSKKRTPLERTTEPGAVPAGKILRGGLEWVPRDWDAKPEEFSKPLRHFGNMLAHMVLQGVRGEEAMKHLRQNQNDMAFFTLLLYYLLAPHSALLFTVCRVVLPFLKRLSQVPSVLQATVVKLLSSVGVLDNRWSASGWSRHAGYSPTAALGAEIRQRGHTRQFLDIHEPAAHTPVVALGGADGVGTIGFSVLHPRRHATVVGIHIPDVAALVPPAMVTDMVIPNHVPGERILPESLARSAGLASGKSSGCINISATYSDSEGWQPDPAVVFAKAQPVLGVVTPEQIDRVLNGSAPELAETVATKIKTLAAVMLQHRNERLANYAMDSGVWDGRAIVRELEIAAGEVVGAYGNRLRLPMLYRLQELCEWEGGEEEPGVDVPARGLVPAFTASEFGQFSLGVGPEGLPVDRRVMALAFLAPEEVATACKEDSFHVGLGVKGPYVEIGNAMHLPEALLNQHQLLLQWLEHVPINEPLRALMFGRYGYSIEPMDHEQLQVQFQRAAGLGRVQRYLAVRQRVEARAHELEAQVTAYYQKRRAECLEWAAANPGSTERSLVQTDPALEFFHGIVRFNSRPWLKSRHVSVKITQTPIEPVECVLLTAPHADYTTYAWCPAWDVPVEVLLPENLLLAAGTTVECGFVTHTDPNTPRIVLGPAAAAAAVHGP